jgi:catechol 2,3-dioxygenase-like lactoylglutathione lyase family enzyme
MPETTVTAPTLDFVVLYVSDLTASRDFFTKNLGFTHLADQDEPGFSQLAVSESSIGFGLVQAGPNTPPPGSTRLYFKTSDLPGLHEILLGKGVEVGPILHPPFGAIFDVSSTDQHLLTMLSN